jgi:hypothetical protein
MKYMCLIDSIRDNCYRFHIKHGGNKMDWFCDYVVPIITMIATGVLAYFTVVLALATRKLHQSTETLC